MATFFSFLTTHKLPPRDALRRVLARPLSWYGIGLYALGIAILVSVYILILSINQSFLTTVPARGGTLIEGMIGAPRLVQPLLASTETDRALVQLLYSGLVRESDDGIVGDLAASYTVSPSGTEYTFTLHPDLKWSDGAPLTSSDVVFTIDTLAMTDTDWRGVVATAPDPQTVVVTLPTPRASFLELATVGIIPMHIWDQAGTSMEVSPYTLTPVGSGPFVWRTRTETDGVTTSVTLKRNRHYVHPKPFIDTYQIIFFANQAALLSALDAREIDMTFAATPQTAAMVTTYEQTPIDTGMTVGVYARSDISQSSLSVVGGTIDKKQIVDTIELGYGIPLGTPTDTPETTPPDFSMAVLNDPTLLAVGYALRDQLAARGSTLTIQAFNRGLFQDDVRNARYTLFLDSLRARDIPPGYTLAVPLYVPTDPLIHRRSVSIDLPAQPGGDRYRSSARWYVRTNNVWKIFNK